jgi:hypothetical protein
MFLVVSSILSRDGLNVKPTMPSSWFPQWLAGSPIWDSSSIGYSLGGTKRLSYTAKKRWSLKPSLSKWHSFEKY